MRFGPALVVVLASLALGAGCNKKQAGDPGPSGPGAATGETPEQARGGSEAANQDGSEPAGPGSGFTTREIAKFDEPWAMTFVPGGRLLVTEKPGRLLVFDPDSGSKREVAGVPEVDYGGQGGLGDVIVHPEFADNQVVYLSWVEAGKGGVRGAVVGRARLKLAGETPGLEDLKVIWRQKPKVKGRGHYGHRLALGPDGYLWITSGERQKFDPAQNLDNNLGAIIRLHDDGRVPKDNPFVSRGGVSGQIWSYGHRNPLGIDFDDDGRLWVHEMGPKGGDELNRIEKGDNYGYPLVSDGDHYDGEPIPDHSTRPDLNAPEVSWNPVISPAGFVIYGGQSFSSWKGNGVIGGLSSRSLIRVAFDGDEAREVARYPMGQRIREVEETPDGGLWILEDERGGSGGRLLELVPK